MPEREAKPREKFTRNKINKNFLKKQDDGDFIVEAPVR